MSVLLDEEAVVLEGLDFEVPCAAGEHKAEFVITCRHCHKVTFICARHLAKLRSSFRDVVTVTCLGCGFTGPTMDDVAEVRDL